MDKFKIKRKVVVEESVSFNQFVAIRIKELRMKRNWSQQDLAAELGLSRSSVVNMEKGRQQLSLKNLYRICERFEVKSSDILPF